ncbi:phosphate signaling complex protein PhoU [Longispora albida]|uniref:phosphate signaling complex protein PhoU n=1 Tax=Longispora albida TaxID=203523 RepID=UPI0004758331|nr:phosphate signaling complex protein PhoU [Longispora albida]
MRDVYRSDLAQLAGTLVAMAGEVRRALRQATRALLEADQVLAENVLADDEGINALYRKVEESVYELLARQSPVAGDLRMVITALHIATDLERMGDLAEHIAKTSLRRHPAVAVPAELHDIFREMGTIADRMAKKVVSVLAERDADAGAELEQDDDQMDALERTLFAKLLGDDWQHGVEPAVDVALLARFYERYADHAVNAGQQVVYLVNGAAL